MEKLVKAIRVAAYGGPELLVLQSVEEPRADDGGADRHG